MRVLILTAVLALAACDTAAPDLADARADAPRAEAQQAESDALAQTRSATARYHRVERALDDGWGAVAISECVAHPVLGGMGYHYINLGLMDGTLDPSAPEILLYEPTKNGKLRLVGVEHVVPFGVEPRAADGGTAPTLHGQTFHENENAGGWTLHVWAWKHNPAGMFADFNPAVSCQYAPAS